MTADAVEPCNSPRENRGVQKSVPLTSAQPTVPEDQLTDCERCVDHNDGQGTRGHDLSIPCPTLRMLALPYADHPDYRQEWRP